ncbi:hypothetical protein FIBSPDRAFT_1020441 [Athelia psychrophila]|uniref:Uncharacterized protein n=1 Tax=Athelia psychrophila TaxID=1759441 RepID=A0A166UZ75_9AGAM|nr:hypothetical protein FIBSPDRAFT_1020441 [Fibularhizoctonia sp. CBS 109695]
MLSKVIWATNSVTERSQHSTFTAPRPRRPVLWEEDPEWFPWADRYTCVLDVMRHLPRASFTQRQNRIMHWGMAACGLPKIPSPYVVKNVQDILQSSCGIKTNRYMGAFGHPYYVNDLASIIAQEWANPLVRPHIHTRPEDSGQRLSDAYQATRWLNELDSDLTDQMARIDGHDFYLFEPALLRSGLYVMPIRWFDRGDQLFARVWSLTPRKTENGWIVNEYDCFEVAAPELSISFAYLKTSSINRGVPDVTSILGSLLSPAGQLEPWVKTNPLEGNRWRTIARGHRVMAFPIWLYCDDTSGNLSKRWNKHNSFLFTAAGLTHNMAHYEYFVHFLCTSNLAPPLEMLDGIVDEINAAQRDGIWAWDCLLEEMVVLIPSVLALLGDNPMQSELSCHVGLNGKFFCRSCFVKDPDAKEASTSGPDESTNVPRSASDSAAGSGAHRSSAGSGPTMSNLKKKLPSMAEMVDKAQAFLRIHTKRERNETVDNLKTIFTAASQAGGQTRSKKLKTSFGIKDAHQDHFTNMIFKFASGLRGNMQSKQAKIDELLAKLPDNLTSPVWRIKDLDPHRDTPVEILHVILLGFVKYFWRDAVARIGNKNKPILISRLDSFDTASLGLSPLSGNTLVTYAGSLTGRDFRAIAQVAPFVLYDLVPAPCFDAWLALSALIPLVWQPVIINLDQHVKITEAIDHFLTCTARWTPRWFNKPKFHIILHLPEHIRRFGPAILFATETFESFNALIRSLSVNSNRMAPSKDIARGFAHANRIRHFMSGGSFRLPFLLRASTSTETSEYPAPNQHHPSEWNSGDFRPIGNGPRGLLRDSDNLREDLGLPKTAEIASKYSSSVVPAEVASASKADQYSYRTCASFVIQNGDKCTVGNWVLARRPGHSDTFVAKVTEILQIVSMFSGLSTEPSFVLVQIGSLSDQPNTYHMSSLVASQTYALVQYDSIVCTVSTPHNCAANKCDMSDQQTVYWERERTETTRPRVQHRNPEDLVLNTSQMRDAVHVQPLRTAFPAIDREQAILTGARAEVDSRKKTTHNSSRNSLLPSGSRSLRP